MGIGTAIGVGGIAGAAGSIGSGILGAGAAENAANTQAGASEYAAQLQAQEAQQALAFQEQQWGTTQANQAPFLQAGQGAVTNLSNLLNQGANGPFGPWTGTFQAPTAAQAAATPGYQFALQQGQQAIQRSAAAQGNLLSGGTLKALDQYSQGLSDTNYQQIYNNQFNQYLQGYNQFQNNQANLYNRLAGLAGTGQVSATNLGNTGVATGAQVGNTLLTTGAQQAQALQNAAAAEASGYIGSANAYGGALGGLGSSISGSLSLYSLLNQLQQNPGVAAGAGSLESNPTGG
jgi:hypothetical protein